MPAVNADLMSQEAIKANGGVNQIAYWSRLPTWKNQTLTPNPDSVYFMAFFNTKDVGLSCSTFHPPTGDHSRRTLTTSGRWRWRMPVPQVPTRAEGANI
jgi:hypothetical protein